MAPYIHTAGDVDPSAGCAFVFSSSVVAQEANGFAPPDEPGSDKRAAVVGACATGIGTSKVKVIEIDTSFTTGAGGNDTHVIQDELAPNQFLNNKVGDPTYTDLQPVNETPAEVLAAMNLAYDNLLSELPASLVAG